MCYVHNQWYDISCATLYTQFVESLREQLNSTTGPPQQNHTVYTNRYHSILEIIANGLLVPIISDFHRGEINL